MLRRHLCWFGLLALGLLAGCFGGATPEVIPPLEPVSGKVTLDGKPVEGIAVTFFPAATNKGGNPSTGSTDASGAFTLKYRNGEPGIAVGDYVVLFSKVTKPDGSPIPEGQTAADVGFMDQMPERYRTTDNAVYTVTVPKGGKTFDDIFNLQSK